MQEHNPYVAPAAQVEVAQPVGELRPGGRGERLVAVILDGLIQGFISMLVIVPIVFFTGFWRTFIDVALRGQGLPLSWTITMVVSGFVFFVLVQGYPLAATGQTWGKKLLKLRIVDLQGRKPDLARLLGLRYAVGFVIKSIPVVGMLYSLADALFIFREDQRCIHDHIAGTRVVVAE